MIFSPSECPVIVVYDKEDTNEWIVDGLMTAGFPVFSFLYGQQFLDAWKENRDGIWSSTTIIFHKDLGDLKNFSVYRQYLDALEDDPASVSRDLHDSMTVYAQANVITGYDIADFLQERANGAQHLRRITGSGEYSYTGVRLESIVTFRSDAGYDPSDEFVPEWVKTCICLGRVTPEEEVFRGRTLMEGEFSVQQRANWLHSNGLRGNERE